MRRRVIINNEQITAKVNNKYSYPDLVDALIRKYGYNYGNRIKPLPLKDRIVLSGFSWIKEDFAHYISIGSPNETICVKLYGEDYDTTYYCAVLSDNVDSRGRASQFFWD